MIADWKKRNDWESLIHIRLANVKVELAGKWVGEKNHEMPQAQFPRPVADREERTTWMTSALFARVCLISLALLSDYLESDKSIQYGVQLIVGSLVG